MPTISQEQGCPSQVEPGTFTQMAWSRSVKTTMIYAYADSQMKRDAIERATNNLKPLSKSQPGPSWHNDEALIKTTLWSSIARKLFRLKALYYIPETHISQKFLMTSAKSRNNREVGMSGVGGRSHK